MKASEQERRDWFIIPLILGIGFLCVIIAGQWALRFSPSWKLNADMDSNLDPNSDFLTRRPNGFIEPIDPSILTEPVWINLFLTPGASLLTGTPFPQAKITSSFTTTTSTITQAPFKTSTPTRIASATNINIVIASPTNTFVYYPPTSTPQPKPTATSTVSLIYTHTPTTVVTATGTSTPTLTGTPTSTPTNSPTPAATNTPTDTPTATTPPFCSTTITITSTSGSYATPSGSTCFQYTDTFANGGIFQVTSIDVDGKVDGGICGGGGGVPISNGLTINYGVEQSGGAMIFRMTGSAGTVDINVFDWTTYPTCP
jgi:hypothetical protein